MGKVGLVGLVKSVAPGTWCTGDKRGVKWGWGGGTQMFSVHLK